MLVLRVMRVPVVLAGLVVLVAVHPLRQEKIPAPLVPVGEVELGVETGLQPQQ
jgi:hypothetical protein